jgi:acyl-CoA thioesterase FadM
LARGEVVMVAFDYKTGQTIPVPPVWREKISAFDTLS